MAQAILLDSKLRLTFVAGLNDKGEPMFKVKTFGNIKSEASSEQLYQFSTAFENLCADQLVSIQRNDSFNIIN
ncbi:DUF1659 domain-containing protein [Cytobacillus purgationiresistens]|uniref:DUF1659 domain-containing protein n=1 Tax=Cytobacillus purgationiresistens TaxID=863449 RepID=A0ABU0AHC2_9BACI|nr:DUF1659 domain-containing protein [Cytobacillus purgationiresistens]MDQ0269823.1 hypothetical protein [Cytobacillus purgationiresistens]